jgi:hypothetical protein
MELSPSGEAASCAATREIPSILWNTNVHSTTSHPISLRSISTLVSIFHS